MRNPYTWNTLGSVIARSTDLYDTGPDTAGELTGAAVVAGAAAVVAGGGEVTGAGAKVVSWRAGAGGAAGAAVVLVMPGSWGEMLTVHPARKTDRMSRMI